MPTSVKPGLLFIFYCLNFAILICLLTAAFFLGQGLFGDLYACNQKTKGEIQYTYDTNQWSSPDLCMVDLNYTANKGTVNEQGFYAIQAVLRCDRIEEEAGSNATTLCYNHYHPEFFASATDADILNAQESHDEAVRSLQLGFKSALWMAFFAFISSAINRNMERLDSAIMHIQDHFCAMCHCCRGKISAWGKGWGRRNRGRDTSEATELQTVSTQQPPENPTSETAQTVAPA